MIRSSITLASLALLASVGGMRAQEPRPDVRLMGFADRVVDQRISNLLRTQDYLLITRDTTLAVEDTISSPVLLLEATLYLDGVLLSDLIAVDAQVFLRPDAEVTGDVINVGGGLYPSSLARVGGTVTDRPLANYFVVREDGLIRIEARVARSRLVLDGVQGFSAPTYDRVDGITLRWGGGYIIGSVGGMEPRIHGFGTYRSARGSWAGGLEFRAGREGTTASVGAERVTRTWEDWIRNSLENTASFFFLADDYYNHYGARRAYARVRHGFEVGDVFAGIGGQLQAERADSLQRRSVFTVSGTPRRNPPVDPGTIASLSLTGEAGWNAQSNENALRLGGEIELASSAIGDVGFARYAVWGDWLMEALADHYLDITWHFQGPLGTRTLPQQRWSMVGGMGTLPVLPIGVFRGDRVVLVRTDYVIPLPEPLRLPYLGLPDIYLQHRVGMAWSDEQRRSLEQNVGLELRYGLPFIRVITDPSDPIDQALFEFGIASPFRGHGWRRRAEPEGASSPLPFP